MWAMELWLFRRKEASLDRRRNAWPGVHLGGSRTGPIIRQTTPLAMSQPPAPSLRFSQAHRTCPGQICGLVGSASGQQPT